MNSFSKVRIKIVFLFTFILLSFPINGQVTTRSITAKFINEPILLDGVMDEPIWQTAEIAGDFQQFFLSGQVPAEYPTEVRVLYSDTHLYVGIYAEKANGNYVVSTLKRDFGAMTNDNISLLFDTFSDVTTAYFFGSPPTGCFAKDWSLRAVRPSTTPGM